MKQITILVVMIFAWLGMSSSMSAADSSKDKNVPAIVFKTKSYDFGTIKEADGKVSCEFSFTNNGKAPLIIISATAGCGCTQPTFDEVPIAPGSTSTIKVTYNPKGRPGEFHKNVTVRTNDPKNGKVVLKISGNVVPQSK